ncbi:type IV pilus secretin family protein [Acanthopleuribacter pedis]|uniref:Type IV pilus secretin PilQ n=1 Tax=Acanthopleuribacter pedis TaxID=442870 RepID=A0A8J7Q3Q2_9BACT|nr:type IV pilus secretin family protein [Acanthopleuribacter pedis]MBO1320002.1 type IV pilus secretin PilQ [Acanthopleuribacter pedis]
MFKKWIAAFCLLFSGAVIIAGDVVIEKAVPMSNDGKTSLVVFYEGAPQLSFFALDTTEGVFSVDFPGATSEVDFSALAFPQVEKIVQEPLDVDAESGIRVRFFLNGSVNCSVYDGAQGEVTLFFKSELPETEAAVVTAHEEVESLPQSAQPVVTQLDGGDGLKRLAHVDAADYDDYGVLRLSVAGLKEYRTFYLKEPNRFVIDLKETLVRMNEPNIRVEGALLQQVRVRQFQREPQPITRCVLDLSGKVPVTIRETEGGLALVYGVDETRLAQAVAFLESNAADLKEAVAEATIVEEPAAEVVVADVADTVSEVSEASVAETATETPQHDTNDETVAVSTNEQVEPLSQASAAAVTEAADVQTEAHEALAVEPEPAAIESAARAISAEADTTDAVQMVTEPSVSAAREVDVPVQNLPVVAEVEAPAAGVSQPAAETAEAGSVGSSLPVFEEAMTAMDAFEKNKIVASAEKADDVMPSFTMVSDLDEEVTDALAGENASGKESLYKMMKGQRSTHYELGTIVVTNTAIESSKLLEMRPMLQDGEGDSKDFASLFEENDDPYETIDGGEVEYRGEEISIIDVKDADVVDLLRFIADQVGINLYVDSSVRDVRATYRFRNIPWDQALDIILTNANLDKQFQNGVLRVATTDKFRREEEARAELRLQRELAVDPVTVTFPLSYANAKEVVPIVEEYLSQRGIILMDERTNTLIIVDIPKKMTAIRTLIKKLDKMISQVTIEARVVESSRRFLRELGVQWGLNGNYSPELGTDTGLDFPNRVGVGGPRQGTVGQSGLAGGYAVNLPVVAENPAGIGLSLGNFLDNFKLDISLQMLESDGEGQIISAPKVTTQNNQTATIKNGQKIPIQTVQRGTVTTTFIDAVLELHVTPHITADETIILDVKVDKSQADFSRTVNGNPVITVREAETKLLVRNGGTAVIGGIFTLNEQSSGSGVPKLRNVPFLKRLFGYESEQFENDELLIFITPKIVKY